MFEIIKKAPYLKILLFFVSFVWFLRFSGTVLPVYFIKSGLTFPQISFGITLSIAGQLFAVFLLARLKLLNRHAWRIALCLYVATFCLYVITPFSGFYFTAAFLSSIGTFFAICNDHICSRNVWIWYYCDENQTRLKILDILYS